MHQRTLFFLRNILPLVMFLGVFGVALGVFFVGASSWWEPFVGAGVLALIFGAFTFVAAKYPAHVLPFWGAGMFGYFILFLVQGVGTECLTADYCTSSPALLSLLYATFSLDLMFLVIFLPGFIIPRVFRRPGGMYMLLGGLCVLFSGLMLFLYLALPDMVPSIYDLVVLGALCVASGALFYVGFYYDAYKALLKRHAKALALALFVGMLLFGSTLPFGA